MRNSDRKIIFSVETEEEIIFVYSPNENGKFYKNLLVSTFNFLEQDLVNKDFSINFFNSFIRSNNSSQKKSKRSSRFIIQTTVFPQV